MKEIFKSLKILASLLTTTGIWSHLDLKSVYRDSFFGTRTSNNIAVKRERANPLSTEFFDY